MLHKLGKTYKGVLSAVIVSAVASGCSSKPLAPEDQNLYDGKWVAQIGETTPLQRLTSWTMDCSNMQGELTFEVMDGVMSVALLGDVIQQRLGAGGKFEFEEMSAHRAVESAGSSTSIFEGDVTNIFRGKLSGARSKGHLDNWVQEVGVGCTTRVSLLRIGSDGSMSAQAADSLKPQFESFRMRAGEERGTLE